MRLSIRPLPSQCPVCDGCPIEIVRSATELTEDTLWTQALFSGGRSRVDAGMLRDTAVFTQSYHAALLSCGACGSLFRDPASVPADRLDRYITDRYDPDYLDRMWIAFISAYQRDHAWNQRHGVRPGARLLEIGSWFGAFLTYATHHGVDAIGLDLGTVASRYARAHGASVIPTGFNLAALDGQRFDSIWCLNCFEQLPDPRRALIDAAALLVPGGHLVIRTPSADFIRLAYQRMPRRVGLRLLAGTNLGGVAYATVDQIEQLAIDRARALFGVEHVNAQAHSGAEANHAVYYALCRPGDTTMGLEIPSGGHLSHGAKPTFVARYYNPVTYQVDRDSELIDYDALAALANEHRPRVLMIGTSSYPRALDWPRLAGIAHAVGAYLVADIAHLAGLVAGGALPSPLPHADVVTTTTHKTLRGPRGALVMTNDAELAAKIDKAVFPGLQGGPHQHHIAGIAVALHEAQQPAFATYARQVVDNATALAGRLLEHGFSLVTGGTDNHLMVIHLPRSGVPATGRQAAEALEAAGLVANRNAIPYDPAPPYNPSGIRYGTPAATTRGMGPAQMRQVAGWTERVLHHLDDTAAQVEIREQVAKLHADFPIPR